ncbi:hypothetical protein BGW80DRAFT_125041 [Lactifluus volemus]|nr:hypothetical protein BGW80DRAFT_125041 [Lactifluus volemus]
MMMMMMISSVGTGCPTRALARTGASSTGCSVPVHKSIAPSPPVGIVRDSALPRNAPTPQCRSARYCSRVHCVHMVLRAVAENPEAGHKRSHYTKRTNSFAGQPGAGLGWARQAAIPYPSMGKKRVFCLCLFVSVWFVVGSFSVHSVSPPPQLLAWVRELQPQLPVALLFTSYRLSVPASVNRGRNATAGLVVAPFSIITINSPVGVH